MVLLEWTVGRTRLRLDYSFFWILTFAACAQNDLLWQVLLFSVLHECGHLAYRIGGERRRCFLADRR